MKILVANVGSSSFKSQLFEMPSEKALGLVAVERVGSARAGIMWSDRNGVISKTESDIQDMTMAIKYALSRLTDPKTGVIHDLMELDAVAFKPLCADNLTGCQVMDEKVLEAMARMQDYIAPMHNIAYIQAVRNFREILPDTPMLGLFETFFFQDWPEYARIYSIPWDWTEKYNVRRCMGHGASHFYVNRRLAEILGKSPTQLNTVQMHLGGSSSLTAVKAGKSIDGSGGFTMQSGPPMSVRTSDMDGFLVAYLWSKGEGTPAQIVDRMMKDAGLASISGIGFDMRDLKEAAEKGNTRARLAIDTYVYQVRKYLGSFLMLLGHTDVITVTAGTGESSPFIRKRILEGLEEFGIVLDDARNNACIKTEGCISHDSSRIAVWVIPANEELVVVRECSKLLSHLRK